MVIYQRVNELLGTNYGRDDDVDWFHICLKPELDENFLREFKDKVFWNCISACQKLTEDFIKEFQDYVFWAYISRYQKLSENFIREFKDKVDWYEISRHQQLSENFIQEFKDKVDWGDISRFQKLSEPFIKKFNNRVDWGWISMYQQLSENFIRQFKHKVWWNNISQFQKLTKSFMEEFEDVINDYAVRDSWLYKDTEFKKRKVLKTGLYECYDDYFIAYKGIRSDRWSKFIYNHQYNKGEIHSDWCDCSSNEGSFGLSAWTKEKAREYCDELVVRVKVRYEDVGRVVHKGGKIRCFKFEVLD